MDDLAAHVDGSAEGFKSDPHDIDRAHDTGAKTTRLEQQHPLLTGRSPAGAVMGGGFEYRSSHIIEYTNGRDLATGEKCGCGGWRKVRIPAPGTCKRAADAAVSVLSFGRERLLQEQAVRCVGDPGRSEGRIMNKPRKCDNPTCTCIPTDKSKYCSAHCEGQAGRTELVCRCGHADCGGNVSGS